MRICHLLLVIALLPLTSLAESRWDVSANLGIQSRFFGEEAAWPGQSASKLQLDIDGELELRWRREQSRASLIVYGRHDGTDSERSLLDLPEAYVAWQGDDIELLVGTNTVFWGVTESLHLVDIINQTDVVADIDGENKLGQPMINLALQRDWGLISLFVLPAFRERSFAGSDGRLRFPVPVDDGSARFESSEKESHVDWAVRYSHYVGDVDIGLSVFDGTSREPRLLADEGALVPYYDQVSQFGLDLQYTKDAWLWKLEAISRDAAFGRFFAAVGGFEYTLFQVGASTADLGLLLEYQYDDRDPRDPLTLAANDVFAGMRLAMNDIQDTAVLAGLGYDTETGETFVNVEAERRFGEHYFAELRLRTFSGGEAGEPTWFIRRDDYIELSASRFF